MREKDALSQVYLFRELTPSEMDILISISTEKRVNKDEVVFKEGARDRTLFFYLHHRCVRAKHLRKAITL